MNLIEEAVIVEFLGIKMYAFGAYVALGALFAFIVLCFSGHMLELKKGTVLLTYVCSAVCGVLVSRVVFCLLNRELGKMTPLSFWPQVDGGGWSMFGLIGGIFLGGVFSAKMAKERIGKVIDSLSLAVLPLIAAERFGESRIEDFDISRPMDSTFLAGSFLSTGGEEPCLATYYVASAVAVILFLALTFRLVRKKRQGDLTVAFLLLFGASAIITESLRYDRFLSISFVGLQQVAAAVTLAFGVGLAVKRSNRPKSVLAIAAILSIPVMVGAVIGLEFALDRTTWNKILLYVLMIVVTGIPAALGMTLINNKKKETEAE